MRFSSGWMWLRKRLADHSDRAGRLAGAEGRVPLCVGLARVRFGLGMAASGMTASWRRVSEGWKQGRRQTVSDEWYVARGDPGIGRMEFPKRHGICLQQDDVERSCPGDAIRRHRGVYVVRRPHIVVDLDGDSCFDGGEAVVSEGG